MAGLGPWEPRPRLAAAVSGGADSTALALLADAWVRPLGGSVLALIVDHTLRLDSAAEAALTAERLTARGIAVRLLRAIGLTHGPAMAERARTERYHLLTAACGEAGILHLLLGHHQADQAETVMIRVLRHSADRGLAAMPALAENCSLRLLRPLLAVPADHLRSVLTRAGMPWIEDPSNCDPKALRARLRATRGAGTQALCDAAAGAGRHRADRDRAIAAILADRVSIRPEGFAILSPGPIAPDALAALVQTIGGAPYAPGSERIAALAAAPGPATLAGVRLLPAGRLGRGWLVVREAAAMAPAITARPGAIWDSRFRLAANVTPPQNATFGPLGGDSASLRRWSDLPAVVLRTLPALRCGNRLAAVPHLLYPDPIACAQVRIVPHPPRPMAGPPFYPVPPGG